MKCICGHDKSMHRGKDKNSKPDGHCTASFAALHTLSTNMYLPDIEHCSCVGFKPDKKVI